ncbi:exodeoxyribonuclease V subunit beta [Ferrimonas lipolytica]|uniref:RecBCD enzyme subunit RecB n=1 Tax=Ferrimonas lipolytica TaxID=2724191 RepID=A0A6H1UE70_9GAMM|nr:exodeoxyribonuclease V subunit beta [Ferrimonas lipolytica]QIZ76890.1 exodeoxyribonuclease V subunit beta [Ferrimonas lipolytica]
MSHILDPITFPLGGTRLIEASAGTGKTFTIAALYLRLVLGHGGDNGHPQDALMPDQILVVTFTKAATEELKDRIRTRLVEAANCFRGMAQPDGIIAALMADYPHEEHPWCARRLELAAQMMDQAAVHTIHSWCQRMLREHAFDSGSLFNLELETDLSALLEEAVRDYWRSHFYPCSAEALAPIAQLYSEPMQLQKDLYGLLGKVEAGDDPTSIAAKQQQKICRCKKVWQQQWPSLRPQIEEALANKQLKYVKAAQLDELQRWFEGDAPLPSTTVANRFGSGGMNAAAKKGVDPIESIAFAALEDLTIELENLDLKQALLRHASQWVADRIVAEKQRLALMGQDDLIIDLGKALDNDVDNQLGDKIRHQFPVAMIDEFQDTDPVQYGIFSALYLNQTNTGLMMIGDPKQAIYAFRGADIYTYLQARDDTVGNHYTLETNYRSSIDMVAAANALFEQAQGYPDGPFMYQQRIPFASVNANGRERHWQLNGEPQAALNLWWDNDNAEPINKASYIDNMSHACAESITEFLNQGKQGNAGFAANGEDGELEPLQASDIAILVRDFGEANAVRDALTAKGVRSVYLSDKESVYSSDEAADLRLILNAVAHPQDDRAVRAALSTRTIGLSFNQLEQLGRNEQAWEQQLDGFKLLLQSWQTQGVLPMVRNLLVRFDVAQRLLAEPARGERCLTNLLHLAELLQAAAASLDGELALLRYLNEQCSDKGEKSDEQVMRLESDAELVKVITIHKSKGLQYKLVFLPFVFNYRPVNTSAPVLFFRDANGQNQLSFNADDEAKASAERERLAEDIRLLYVAVTRAEYACYLGLAPLKIGKGKKVNVHLNALGKLLADGAELDVADIGQQLQRLAQQPHTSISAPMARSNRVYSGDGEPAPLPPVRHYSRKPLPNWWISSYSGLLRDMSHQHDDYATEARPEQLAEMMLASSDELELPQQPEIGTIHAFPKGAAPGTFLHDLFEWAAIDGVFRYDADEVEQHLHSICPSNGFAGEEAVLASWFAAALQVPLPLFEQQASLLELPLAQPELEFWFEATNVDVGQLDRLVTESIWPGEIRPQLQPIQLQGMLKGFIDLTFYYQGRYYVADYKSNYLGPDQSAYQAEAMRAAMLEHRYELQAVLYSLALHRLLQSRLPDYDYERDVGGGLYIFLRGLEAGQLGQGALTVSPPKQLIEQLDCLFRGEELVDG